MDGNHSGSGGPLIANTAASWGHNSLDQLTHGLVKGELNVLECNDFHAATVTLGRFINAGLKNGETAAFVVFDSPNTIIKNFQNWNIDFETYLRSEQLFILSLQSKLIFQRDQRTNFQQFFTEIENLCKGHFPDRIAIQGLDYLLDISNPQSTNQSVAQFFSEILQRTRHVSTLLGSFLNYKNNNYQELAIALQRLSSSYFTLQHEDSLKNEQFTRNYWFLTKKIPWFNFRKSRVLMQLNEGEGLVEKAA